MIFVQTKQLLGIFVLIKSANFIQERQEEEEEGKIVN